MYRCGTYLLTICMVLDGIFILSVILWFLSRMEKEGEFYRK